MEESKIENSSAYTELAVVEKDNSDDKNVLNGDAEVIEKDPDIRKDDTYRIYDYLKANPVLTVAILSGTAALITMFLNMFVSVVSLYIQQLQGISFYYTNSNSRWYYTALLSLIMVILMALYSFIAMDIGETTSHNIIMSRYAKAFSRYATRKDREDKKRLKSMKRVLKRLYKNTNVEESELKNINIELNKLSVSLTERRRIVKSHKKSIFRINSLYFFRAIAKLILPVLLYTAFLILTILLSSGSIFDAIIPLLIGIITIIIMPFWSFILSASIKKIPRCTDENIDEFHKTMDTYIKQDIRPFLITRIKDKGFRAFCSDRVIFSNLRSLLVQVAITCIVVGVSLFLVPQTAKNYRIIEYDDKVYIVVAKEGNEYALIEANIINDDTLEIHKSIERHLNSEDLVIEKKTFSKVLFND